ncbi:MAG TPA: RNA methyltransferase [Rhabdochlamydiaceae bacterium]|nr:RNA methyltransferase [Rhabdochlamydiaceae bacterium]
MKHRLEITSSQNLKVKKAYKLRERRERDEEGLFLIEGYRELKRAADAGVHIKELFICPEFFLGSNEQDLIHLIDDTGAEVFKCAPRIFEKISYRDRPDGLMAVAHQMKRKLKDLSITANKQKDPFFIVAEAIEKPGNLGTILRSADAVGADGVIVCDRCTDIYNPNVVRASVGTLFTIPVVEAEGSETLLWLQKKKIKVIASTPSAKVEFTDADMMGPVAIVVGTEQLGLSEAWMNVADLKVRIPMLGIADSLNVATATTLLLYEVLRQRRKGGVGMHFF